MVHYSTTWRPTAMACPALLMMLRKSSTVLFAPNKLSANALKKKINNSIILYAQCIIDTTWSYIAPCYRECESIIIFVQVHVCMFEGTLASFDSSKHLEEL